MAKPFHQIEWDEQLEDDCRQLARLAVREDLDRGFDWTTVALVGEAATGAAHVVARRPGIIAGLRAAHVLMAEYDSKLEWRTLVEDGAAVDTGCAVAHIAGSARSMLAAERPVLNLIGHLSGVATLTSRFVAAVAHTRVGIFDTRKTMPGWRRLDKLAVRLGGGTNHRTGLFDAVLIKDNHLSLGATAGSDERFSPAEAVAKVRRFLDQLREERGEPMIVEVEVDSLDQLAQVLPAMPDVVLLDNMSNDMLRAAVEMRDRISPQVELEASGGVSLDTVAKIAESGVDRVSVGALTHSAAWFDVGLDWLP